MRGRSLYKYFDVHQRFGTEQDVNPLIDIDSEQNWGGFHQDQRLRLDDLHATRKEVFERLESGERLLQPRTRS